MSHDQPTENFWVEWTMDPMLSSGQQLYAGGATVSGPNHEANYATGNVASAFTDHVCYTCHPFKTFARLGDLSRHQREIHNPVTAAKYLCPIDQCPRGIQGGGFGRMHHLVTHLKSKKHEMDGKQAAFLARQHNMPKSKERAAAQ